MLEKYSLKLVLPECNPSAVTVNAVVDLEDDISDIMPYLNAVVKAGSYDPELPCLRFTWEGKVVILYPRRIAISKLQDEVEAGQVLESVLQLIRSTCANRETIKPSFEKRGRVKALDVFRHLPRSNCGRCGEPTCLAFAVRVALGEKGPGDCPPLSEPGNARATQTAR